MTLLDYSTGLKCKVQLPCAMGAKEDTASPEKSISISPWGQESACVKPPKDPELTRLPKFHTATERGQGRRRKVNALGLFLQENGYGGNAIPVHWDVIPAESEFCPSVTQTHQLKCNQHNLLE